MCKEILGTPAGPLGSAVVGWPNRVLKRDAPTSCLASLQPPLVPALPWVEAAAAEVGCSGVAPGGAETCTGGRPDPKGRRGRPSTPAGGF